MELQTPQEMLGTHKQGKLTKIETTPAIDNHKNEKDQKTS